MLEEIKGEVSGTSGSAALNMGGASGGEQKKLKPCCACPETKQPRDKCIVEQGEENCQALIEAHRACMKRMGFNI